ncbi:hypothetical protein ACHAXS_006523 [Conticribra weissflogii]
MSSSRGLYGRRDDDDDDGDDFYGRGRPPSNYGDGRQPRLSFATPMATPMSPFDSEGAVNSRDASLGSGGVGHGGEHGNGAGGEGRGDNVGYPRRGEERPSSLRSGVKATPNSLTQSTGGPVNSSRAERKQEGARVGGRGNVNDRMSSGDGRGNSSSSLKSGGNSIGKTPNSLVNSRGPTTTRAETKGDYQYYNRGRDEIPSRTKLPPSSSQQRSKSADRYDVVASASSSLDINPSHKHTKSYVERYHDIKQMSMNDSNEHVRERNRPRHNLQHNTEEDMPRRLPPDRRSTSAGRSHEDPRNRYGRNVSPISAKYRNDAHVPPVPPPPPRPMRAQGAGVGNATPSFVSNIRPPDNRNHGSTHKSNYNSGRHAQMMLSPQHSTRTDQTVSPTSRASSFATEQSSRTPNSSTSPSSAHSNRWSPQRNTYDDYDQYETKESNNRDGYDFNGNQEYHSPDHRPDPAGEPNPYDVHPNSTLADTNNSQVGERSPLFDDVEEEPGTGNMSNIGHNSSLSIDHRFEDEGESTTSTYADNLKSFSEKITGAVSGSGNGREDKRLIHHQDSRDLYGRSQQQLPPSNYGHNDDEGIGSRLSPNRYDDRNDQSHYQDDDHNSSSLYQEKRVRWGATDFCKRFTEHRRGGDGGADGRSRHASNRYDRRYDTDRNRRNTWNTPSSSNYDLDPYRNNGYDEYDRENPTTVASLEKSKRMYLIMALTVCVACIVAVAVTVTYFKGESNGEPSVAASYITLDPTPSPTTSRVPSGVPSAMYSEVPSSSPTERPTTERERLIGEFLEYLSSGDSNIPGTPQYRAKMWLLFEDEMNLYLSQYDAKNGWASDVAERIKQRFALATMYYSMGVGEGGVTKGWLEGDECRNVGDYGWAWDGVACTEDGKVRALALVILQMRRLVSTRVDKAGLAGHIPPQVTLLKHVENLIIKNNPGLRGTIPSIIGNMSQLRQLGLYGNDLTGTVPKSISQLSNLVYLNLSNNKLMGQIDWEGLSHLPMVTRLILHNNFLEGSIQFHLLAKMGLSLLGLSNNLFSGYVDETLGGLTSLEYLYLDGNKLIGELPSSLGHLTNLKALNIDENEIDGTLPSTIGNLLQLEYLSAKSNRLTGGIPTTIKSLMNLSTLNLASNALTGPIRPLIGMTGLKNVHLYQNTLTGSIPAGIFALPNLENLFLSSNHLSGTLPGGIVNAQASLTGLYLSDNFLRGTIPNQICSVYQLENVFLDTNGFSGPLPSCLAELTRLRRFLVFKNQLTGEIPSGLSNLAGLVQLGIEENNFTGGVNNSCGAFGSDLKLWADCDELLDGCDCCTKCCSDGSSNC